MFKAYIVEYERGWGSRVDETKEFPTREERDAFVRDYNAKHIKPLKPGERVPDWYMVAEKGM